MSATRESPFVAYWQQVVAKRQAVALAEAEAAPHISVDDRIDRAVAEIETVRYLWGSGWWTRRAGGAP